MNRSLETSRNRAAAVVIALLMTLGLAAPASAATGSSRDKRDDVEKIEGIYTVAKVSHPVDIYRVVLGDPSEAAFSIKITVDRLTSRIASTRGGNFDYSPGANIYINGRRKFTVWRGYRFEGGQLSNRRGMPVQCGDDQQVRSAIEQTLSTSRNLIRFEVPKSCLGVEPGDEVSVQGISSYVPGDRRFSFYDISRRTSALTVE